jgi:hypothetical protein
MGTLQLLLGRLSYPLDTVKRCAKLVRKRTEQLVHQFQSHLLCRESLLVLDVDQVHDVVSLQLGYVSVEFGCDVMLYADTDHSLMWT